MTRSDSPSLFLAEPVTKFHHSQPRTTNTGDTFFLVAAMILVVGGCLFVLDMAAAKSTASSAVSKELLNQVTTWTPNLVAGSYKYVLLLLASVINSALIVTLVYGLRSMDLYTRFATNNTFTLTRLRKQQNIRRPRNYRRVPRVAPTSTPAPTPMPTPPAAAPSYLLSPIFK